MNNLCNTCKEPCDTENPPETCPKVGYLQLTCDHYDDFMHRQKEIILQHITDHKYYRHIENKDEAIVNFIQEFGWIMREMYCLSHCPHGHSCEILNNLRRKV